MDEEEPVIEVKGKKTVNFDPFTPGANWKSRFLSQKMINEKHEEQTKHQA